MIPEPHDEYQPQPSPGTMPPGVALVSLEAELAWPENDSGPSPQEDGPKRCPTCRRAHFEAQRSELLDRVLLAIDVLSDVKAVLEEVVIP